MSLVIWIAVMKYLIQLLYIYVDDSFSAQKRGERLFYKRYHKYLPSNLTRLLQLWDFIGLPHEEHKQVFGDVLPIIGFEADPNLMRVCMSDESKLQLITAVRDFALHGTRRPKHRKIGHSFNSPDVTNCSPGLQERKTSRT